MRTSHRSGIAATVGFVLIAGVVIGGMGWGTYSQLRLVDVEARARHRQMINFGMWRMEERLIGFLQKEASRPYTDYMSLHTEEAEVGWTEDGTRVGVDVVVVQSPLTRLGPEHDWIDLYFQVDENGHWSSPQVDEEERWAGRSAQMLYWLQRAMPVAELSERTALARARDPRSLGVPAESHQQTQVIHRVAATGVDAGGSGYESRRLRGVAAQISAIPATQCLALDHIHTYDIHAGESESDVLDLFACSPPKEVGLTPDPMAAFWLDVSPIGEGRKLAFVRTGHEDDKIVYQGVVVDWQGMEAFLLESMWDADIFPNARLEPVADDQPPDREASDTALSAIPARLTGPGVVNTGAEEARRSIMGALALAWTIALAVLALAGVGIRSLLALTTRRLRFAYAVTHELRTPLTTFQLYTDMLADGLVPEESKQEYLDSLKRESQRLSRLVQGVLEYARLENQKAKLNPIQTDAPAVIQKIAETLTARCEDSEVKSTAENMVPNGCMFRTDVDLVTQIAGVLIDNAVRHAKQSDDPSVCVQLSAHDNRLEIDVTDSGPGIARADTRRVFKPFRRGKTAEVDAHRGIGLGLSLAQSWARLLGGRLYLVARNDPKLGGAHFRLSVPQNI